MLRLPSMLARVATSGFSATRMASASLLGATRTYTVWGIKKELIFRDMFLWAGLNSTIMTFQANKVAMEGNTAAAWGACLWEKKTSLLTTSPCFSNSLDACSENAIIYPITRKQREPRMGFFFSIQHFVLIWHHQLLLPLLKPVMSGLQLVARTSGVTFSTSNSSNPRLVSPVCCCCASVPLTRLSRCCPWFSCCWCSHNHLHHFPRIVGGMAEYVVLVYFEIFLDSLVVFD